LAQQPVKKHRKQIQPAPGPEKAFGQALRKIRESREISQERLALEGGFDRTYISLIERGINSPTIRVLVGIAAVLKVPPSKIVRRMERLIARTKPAPRAAEPRKQP
jgi:transcriptional regulator with XRE-family HTH domain